MCHLKSTFFLFLFQSPHLMMMSTLRGEIIFSHKVLFPSKDVEKPKIADKINNYWLFIKTGSPLWACLFFSKYYTMMPMPIGLTDILIGLLCPTNPPPRMPRMQIKL